LTVAPLTVDPVRLAEYAFGHDHWDTPAAILRAVFRPNSRVAVKACHASSKTFTAADAVLLALMLEGDVLTTAPTWEQVKTVLWGQIRRAIFDGRMPVREWGEVSQTEIRLPTGEVALGLSTNEGVRFQGWHARPDSFLLVIFDEAPGVRPDIYEAVEGISAGGDVRLLLLGNPIIASGPFYDIYAGDSPGWQRFTIDAFDTPNLRGLGLPELLALDERELDVSERPYLVTRRWVRDHYREWGEDHPLWQSRVRGQFPLQSEDALLSLAWLEGAANRPRSVTAGIPVQAGLDVAGPGEDETVLTIRQGGTILHQQAWAQADPRGEVIATVRPYAPAMDLFNVDSVGLGYGMYLHLKDTFGDRVKPVNVGMSPTNKKRLDDTKFLDLKAEMYWNLRDWFSGGTVAGLRQGRDERGREQRALSQLASIRYGHDHEGRVWIEPKDKALKRGVKSPDWAESTALAFWVDPRGLRTATYGTRMPLVRNGRR
jgi:phage terminase large subunit